MIPNDDFTDKESDKKEQLDDKEEQGDPYLGEKAPPPAAPQIQTLSQEYSAEEGPAKVQEKSTEKG